MLQGFLQQIWKQVFKVTNSLVSTNQVLEEPAKACLGAQVNSSSIILTINAEILTRIMMLRDTQDYLIHPKKLLELSLKRIQKREIKTEIKNQVGALLEQMG